MARTLILILACILAPAGHLLAAPAALIIPSSKADAYTLTVASIRAGLGDTELAVATLANSDALKQQLENDSLRLIVTVGMAAARWVSAQQTDIPVLHTLIPLKSFEQLHARAPEQATATPRLTSALCLDQPLSRQLELVRLLVPRHTHIGVLAGPSSATTLPELEQLATKRKFSLSSQVIGESAAANPALESLLMKADVVLALPDPVVFNRESISGLLLTTFSRSVPVIGFSQSYVRAGALGAVYSTPAQVGRQAAEVIKQYLSDTGGVLPAPQPPRYFSVELNPHVGRALGIHLPDADYIKTQLQRREQTP